ncbi:MAG: TetR/AcrR family transcriptional regulator [Rubrivivax sp.]|nr:MAG: TetR/AcrR family transcriptional regulator [Rubrivivax sp.]
MTRSTADPAAPADPRQRLLDGLAAALHEHTYAEVTVAHVVSQARVSRRTFYEHFASKEEALLALCEAVSQQILSLIAVGYDHQADWVAQLRRATQAYLGALEQQPVLIRTLFIELMSLGPKGWQVRRQIHQRFADFIQMQVELSRLQEPRKRPLSPALALGIVGGINELIVDAIERGQAAQLSQLAGAATELVEAVLRSLEPAD